MKKLPPSISVIIPAYNEEKLIGKCLKALTQQNYPKDRYEVIVVDNDSTDKTASITEKYPATLLRYNKIKRVSAARQYGSSHASGKILAFMDADSYADPNWLSTIDRLLGDSSLVAVCGIGLPSRSDSTMKVMFSLYNYGLVFAQVFGLVLPWGFNFAIKKSAFDKVGGYNLSMQSSDDVELGMRISKKFGKKSIRYVQSLRVYTSTRKQQSLGEFILLVRDTFISFTNLIILHKAKPAPLRTIR